MTQAGAPVTLWSQTLLTPYDVLKPGWLTMRGSTTVAMGAGDPPGGGRTIDLGDRVVTPGFVDVHVHGAVGAQVNGNDATSVASAVRRIAAYHATRGTTALLATTVCDALEPLRETIRGIGRYVGEPGRVGEPQCVGARVLGAHLEGPWLSPTRAGAHNPRHLRAPSVSDLHDLLAASPGVVRMITLAPELPGAGDLVAELVKAGVVASVGHTEADLVTTKAAFDAGARHVTHLFNAMPTLDHRRPGPVGAALSDHRVTVELIADGVHVDPLLLGLVMREAAGRVVAVTDATSATGLGPGRFMVGDRAVDVSEDRVVLSDAPATLAGSILTMDRAVSTLVAAGASLSAAVTAASATPAGALGAADLGVIRVGARADLVVLDADCRCVATIIGGRTVYDPGGLLGWPPCDEATRNG